MFTFADAVREWSIKTPTAPAWWEDIDGQLKALSWRQVEQALVRVASSLSDRGLVAGDRLVSYLPNSLGWALLDLACCLRGIVHVPVDYRLPENELESIVDQTQGFLVRSIAELHWSQSEIDPQAFEDLRKPVCPEDLMNILYTSGTTGAPLGVMLSHENLIENARGKLDAVPQNASDRRLNILPFSHAYARTCELSTWALSGGSMMSVQSYEQFLANGPRLQPTLINAVPYIFQKLQKELESFSSNEHRKQALTSLLGSGLRCLASGGAGLPSSVYRFFQEIGLPIIQGYGLTEASPVVCSNRSDAPKENCVGPPIQNTEIRIDAEQRLFVRGPGVMLGYWNNRSETQRRIQNGWLVTGDQAEHLSDGTLRILGRLDDRIVLSTGHKVDPTRIEQCLTGKSGIRNCMLIGSGQRFLIAILVVDGDQETNLLQTVQDSLSDYPDYCIPKRLIIEKNDWTESSGMVNRKGSPRRTAIAEHYRFEIAAIYCSTLGRKQIALNPSDRPKQDGDRTEQGNEVQQ